MDSFSLDSPEIVKNFETLNKLGILKYIDSLKMEIKDLDELIVEAEGMFRKHSVKDLITFVIQLLVEKFIPSYLVFIIQDGSKEESPSVLCFHNMKLKENSVSIKSLKPFSDFFIKYPNTISFQLLEYKMERKDITDSLLPFNPDIIVPLLGISGLYGIIAFGKKVVGDDYSQQDIVYLDKLMKFASISIQNNIHYQSAISDLKTGLYNHDFFISRLKEELTRVERYDEELSVLMMDIDYFKKLNDTYGHMAGDEVLINISNTIKNSIRMGDLASRFGGEEFALIVIQGSISATSLIAERIRSAVENMSTSFMNQELRVTISIGVRHVNKYNVVKPHEIINDADSALYKAKKNGRNCVSFYGRGLLHRALECS